MDMGKTPVLAAYKYGCGKLRNGKAKRVRTILNVLEKYNSHFRLDSTYICTYQNAVGVIDDRSVGAHGVRVMG